MGRMGVENCLFDISLAYQLLRGLGVLVLMESISPLPLVVKGEVIVTQNPGLRTGSKDL